MIGGLEYILVKMLALPLVISHSLQIVDKYIKTELMSSSLTLQDQVISSPIDKAKQIQMKVMMETDVYVRASISSTKILAKTACDNFVKKYPEGILCYRKKKLKNFFGCYPFIKCIWWLQK
jgi:nucleotidyltransferase/DNA polymerase involved in DNA repair